MKMKNAKKPALNRRPSAPTVTPPQVLNLLATTDFSAESRSGVRYASILAKRLGAAVTLLHVIEVPARLSSVEAVILARDDAAVIALARKELATLARRAGKDNVPITTAVRMGKPFHEITTGAGEDRADLIVIATHGYTGAKRIVLGSTAERVVRHAPCPVLTVPTQTPPMRTRPKPGFRLKKILVPIDFSNLSKDALPWATFLASHLGAELVLLHVIEQFPVDYLLGRELMSHALVPLMKQTEAELERVAADLSKSAGVQVSAAVRDGKPYEAICHAAKRLGVDLIALTTHGYTGLKHVWLGSTAERVVRHAPCPVLTVRATKPRP